MPELGALEAEVDGGSIEVTSEEIPDDWTDRWRDFHKPIVVGDRLVVAPSWEEDPSGGKLERIVVDPGQAFGTGAHATTRMCLELLIELAESGAAAGPARRLGHGLGRARDRGRQARLRPGLGLRPRARRPRRGRGERGPPTGSRSPLERRNLRSEPAPIAPTVTANLTAPVLLEVAARLEGVPERLVCSGLLHREADGVAAAFAAHGLAERRRLSDGDWTALLLTV